MGLIFSSLTKPAILAYKAKAPAVLTTPRGMDGLNVPGRRPVS